MLRDRVCALEKKVYDQNDEITCLRATLADCLRRINGLELNKGHVQISNVSNLQKPRLRSRDSSDNLQKTPMRRPISGSYSSQDFNSPMTRDVTRGDRSSHESVNRRASYASNRDKQSAIYNSSNSLHTDSTSNSMSPAPSPTTNVSSRLPPNVSRPLSAVSLHKKWSSTSDFRELSPGPGQMSTSAHKQRQNPSGSLGMCPNYSEFYQIFFAKKPSGQLQVFNDVM